MSITVSQQVGATFQALVEHGPPNGQTVDSSVVYAVVGLVDYLQGLPRELTQINTASVVRRLHTTRPTLTKAWQAAEEAGLLERESRYPEGSRRVVGFIRFTDGLLRAIDRITE